jgi:hypothetical protein
MLDQALLLCSCLAGCAAGAVGMQAVPPGQVRVSQQQVQGEGLLTRTLLLLVFVRG